jgi:Transcription factor zinc-finger
MHAAGCANRRDNCSMIEIATQLLRGCPQCGQTMAHLALQGHGAAPVVVDHCAPCRLVWFDALESVQLAGLGWVRLLRELQRGLRSEPVAPRPATLACPACRSALKAVHNQTRFGHFAALECPQHHGHLHSHAGMLAERGLVRPVLPVERNALIKEQRVWHCFNCGARSEGHSEHCSYCDSPLLVIDLPRLAHSLLRRPGDDDRSPVPDGVPLAWACRGCGHALDPSREVACLSCGHAVVAPSLLDINPLLIAIETRLMQADQAARPYRKKEARVRSWRETGLGMLERFWRSDPPEGYRRLKTGWVMMVLLVAWLLWVTRR